MQHDTADAYPFCMFRSFEKEVAAPLSGKLHAAEMTFTRVGFGRDHHSLHIEMERQDAYYLIFQLRDHPSHDYWSDGRGERTPDSPRGSVHIADLNAIQSALLDKKFDSLNIVIPRAFLNELAEDANAPLVPSLTVPEPWTTLDPVLGQLAPVLVGALEEPASVSSLFIDHITTAMGLHLAERYGELRQTTLRPGGLAPWQERRARDMIAANLAKDITLAEVATECGLSLAHFSKAFKASVGVTPHGWLQARRLDRAKDLLRRSGIPLAQVAVRCGFADQSHFSRIFKRTVGMTPGAWRRLYVPASASPTAQSANA